MSYLIQPYGIVNESYISTYETEEDAFSAARTMAAKYYKQVDVYKLVGRFVVKIEEEHER